MQRIPDFEEESIFIKTKFSLITLAILGTIWYSDFLGRTLGAGFQESSGPVRRLVPSLLTILSAQKVFYNVKWEKIQA
jgi:hypothetical protein